MSRVRHFYLNKSNRLRLYAQALVSLYEDVESFKSMAETQPQVWPRIYLKQLEKDFEKLQSKLSLGLNTDEIEEFTPTEKKKVGIHRI